MNFYRTYDLELVKHIMTEPTVYPFITDDSAPAPSDFQPHDHPAIWYVLCYEGETLLGMWMLVPQNSVCWEIHTCLLPAGRGAIGRIAAQQLQKWIWANTPCRRVVTNVPAFNKLALKYAKEAGMYEFGVNPKSFAWRGALYDQTLLGISRPEAVRMEVA